MYYGYYGNSLLGLIILVLDVFAIVEIVKSGADNAKKALWVIVILLLPVVGLILWYFLGRK
jgi:Phospholipase_D-nuclease N-terminal